MPRRSGSLRTPRARRPAFTLLETALALVIVLVGVLSIMEAQTAFIRSNNWSSQEATGTYLANEIRERMRSLPRHDPIVGLRSTGSGAGFAVWPGAELDEQTVEDLDDIDDYNTVLFASNGQETFPGPIDAFGGVIPETDPEGFVVMNGNAPLALQGWSQYVQVEKVDPYNVAIVRDWAYADPPAGSFEGRPVDKFPLRVTVTVFYQGLDDPSPQVVTTMSWIEPGR